MNEMQKQPTFIIKQQHSEVFTLKSINSQQQILQLVPTYNNDTGRNELIRSGHWSIKQHVKYIMFLDYFSTLFILKHNKKLWKIFTIMSLFIKTRNSSQCRSHHQKTQRKYKSVDQILKNQKQKYRNYDIRFQQMKKTLQKLPVHNPVQINKPKQTTDYLPSIKVLNQNETYPLYRNSLSMIDINHPKQPLKSRRMIGSQKIVHFNTQKYIGSECSIQMQDEADEDSNKKYKEIFNQLNNKQNQVSQHPWLVEYSLVQKQQKNQKLIKTTDTYTDEQMNRHANLVRMKKSRSSLPSFDLLSTVGDSQCSQKSEDLKTQKKQSTQSDQHKCKTYFPGCQKSDSEDSWLSQKVYNHQQPITRSLFSGFVSSLDSVTKSFQLNQILGHDQYTSFNNFCNAKDQQKQQQQNFFCKNIGPSKIKKVNSKQANQRNQKSNTNIFFCQDFQKGNLCNQIQDGDPHQSNSSIDFLPIQPYKIDQIQQNYEEQNSLQNVCFRNFTKKKSSKLSEVSVGKKKTLQIQTPILQKQVQNHAHPIIQEEKYSELEKNQKIINYENQISFDPKQYPLIQIYVKNFFEFFMFFIIWKTKSGNFYFN